MNSSVKYNELMALSYPSDEVQRIEEIRANNTKTEEMISMKRNDWNRKIEPLFVRVKGAFQVLKKADDIIDIQSLMLTYRQQITEEISKYLNVLSKVESSIKQLKQEKFSIFATESSVKLNVGEKTMLIEGNLSENYRQFRLIETYIEFLRGTHKNLETLGFTLKSIIELHSIIDLR